MLAGPNWMQPGCSALPGKNRRLMEREPAAAAGFDRLFPVICRDLPAGTEPPDLRSFHLVDSFTR
jgi:hypothetical protein